jgi:hypothetical protein
MSDLRAQVDSEEFGKFQVIVTPPKGKTYNVSMFRGTPVQISDLSSRDPFGDATCSLAFPQVTIFDRPEQGDLSWLKPYSKVDIRFIPAALPREDVRDEDKTNSESIIELIEGDSDSPIPGMEPPSWYQIDSDVLTEPEKQDIYRYPLKKWKWEGFIASFDISSDSGLSVQCKGALYQLDNYLAKPEYPRQPIPYEILIKRAFNPRTHPGLMTNPVNVIFPENWKKQVLLSAELKPGYLQPFGISPGDDWTGLTSRSTGSWDPTLTSFVQGLLSVMFTDDGRQWTIYKAPGRQPILKLRREPSSENTATLVVNAENPGVELNISRDWSQSVNVIYGSGKDLAGVSFSGQKVTPDGKNTYYQPFAHAPQAYPATKDNESFDPYRVVPKEGLLQFPQGLNELDAREVARQQYRRFSDPGFTGTITLKADPTFRGFTYPRYFISAGQSIAVRNMMGYENVVFHIVECSVDIQTGTVNLSVDSKFRDFLTWNEIRARTRDALIPLRSLQIGQYSNVLQDLLKPWSNRDGSGVIPSGPNYDATKFFNDILPKDAKFPYEEWTRKHPPKDPDSRQYYIKVPAANKKNANDNWAGESRPDSNVGYGFPVKAAQAGNIRLTQIAAYDRNGNIKKVPFHVGFYYNRGINVQSMPRIPAEAKFPDYVKNRNYEYEKGQHYPFFKNAWERVNSDGEVIDERIYGATTEVLIGWGNYFEPAGYWPGLKSAGDNPTGKLVDESPWSFDCSNQPDFDPYDKKRNMNNPNVGVLYCMIFCDDDTDEPTYFMGRLFREEPGAS